jgi:diguanylate cyclase (GGDEF)-like protein
VRDLPAAEAGREYPVAIRGVVTYANVANGELFVQDQTAGIFVFVRNSKYTGLLEWGRLVEVDGVSASGDFSSSITKADIQVLSATTMPKPLRGTLDHLSGSADSQWGELKGIARSGRENNGLLSLNVAAADGAFLVIMRDYPHGWKRELVDSKLTFQGVLAAAFNEHRQAVGLRLFVPSMQFIHIDDPAPQSPFDLPMAPAASVGAFQTSKDEIRRIRVRGTVTAVVSPTLAYFSDGKSSLAVELDPPGSMEPGELIDLVGFPGEVEGRPGLKNAIWRLIARGRDLLPQQATANEIVTPEDQNAGSGLAIAAGTRYDLRLIAIEGTLLQRGDGPHSKSITLTSMGQFFSVSYPDSAQKTIDEIDVGSHLRLTGVCLVSYDEYRRAESFRLLIRQPGDIAILSRPSWLTLQRAVWIIGLMVLSVIAAVTWITLLHNQVAGRTEELRVANERLGRAAAEDGLTGAANRRRFDELLKHEMSRAGRTNAPLSLVMVDIDHFKALNDLYGHQVGDHCLIRVVQAIRKAAARAEDVVARYGGEEFAVILPNTGDEAANGRAEVIRRAVEELEIVHAGAAASGQLTVSLGVATLWPGSTYAAEELLSFADSAMYEAKHSGRNQVVSWRGVDVSPLPASVPDNASA